MRPPNNEKPTAGDRGLSEDVSAAAVEPLRDNESPDPKQGHKPLIDKFGHAHSESVLRDWSPAMLRIMGIRRARP
jgi:hypothetical protein